MPFADGDGLPDPDDALTPPDQLPGALLSSLAPGSFGPHLVRSLDGWIAIWETPSGANPGWYSASWKDDDQRIPPPEPVLGPSRKLLKVHAAGVPSGGVAVLLHRRSGQDGLLELFVLDAAGKPRFAPLEVKKVQGAVLWIQAIPTAQGVLCVWAEQGAQAADLRAALVSQDKVLGQVELSSQVSAWQIARHGDSLALATLEGAQKKTVKLRMLDGRGAVVRAPLTLSEGSVEGGLDLDLVVTTKRIVAAWSERSGLQTRIVGALLDNEARLRRRSTFLTVPSGNQALVRLVADPENDDIVLVWDETDRSSADHELALGRLRGDELATAEATLFSNPEDPLLPQLALLSGRLFVLSYSALCDEGSACAPTRTAFTASIDWRSDGAADLRALSARGGPSMLWDLTCGDQKCMALAADSADPTRVYAVDVPSSGELPAPLARNDDPVRISSRRILSRVPELSGLSGAENADGQQVVAWLSYFDPSAPYVIPTQPAPDGRRAPVRARLETFVTKKDLDQDPPVLAQVISYRARSLGGVSVVAPRPQGLLAWAALDGNDPQLFATTINSNGARLRQKMLTRSKGEVTDVTAIRTDTGYLVAWVDGRNEQQEVWAMALSPALQSAGAVQISRGARRPSGVNLLLRDGEVLALWSDARGTTERGAADLFTTLLDPATAQPRQPEQRLVSTVTHCHSPALSVRDDGEIVVTWIESSTGQMQDPKQASVEGLLEGSLRWATWDGKAKKVQSIEVPGMDGVSRYSVSCRDTRCAALVSCHGQPGAAELFLSVYDGGRASAHHLSGLQSGSPLASTPLLMKDVGFIAEKDPAGAQWVLSRIGLIW